MKKIDGIKIAKKELAKLKKDLAKRKKKPCLAVILIGDNKASNLYVAKKEESAKSVGMDFLKKQLPASTNEKEVLNLIKKLNKDEQVNGIIVQLPLPSFFNTDKIIDAIDPRKDVDGFCKRNRKDILAGNETKLEPVLPKTFLLILDSLKFDLEGKKVAAVVNSEIFGKVLKAVFEKRGAHCSYLVKKVCLDKGLEQFLGEADVVISVTGCPRLINGSMIKKESLILDAGIFWEAGRMIGDVDMEAVASKASFVTPTPGGIGPVTVALLLKNVYLASKLKNN